jgi:cysteine desulfurase/selenocysteine lyase
MGIETLRADFPILTRSANGHPLVYLDSAATSQKPRQVLEAEEHYYAATNANVHRGVYALSVEATDAYEHARAKLASFVGAPDPNEVVFVRGTTEAINLVATSLGHSVLGRGDRVVTTIMEHHSNIVPWQFLRENAGVAVDFVDIDDAGRLRMDELDRLLAARPKVVTVTHVSNVLGTVNPVREIAERAHAKGALVVVDAAQSVPHRPVNVRELGADFVAFSGHKMLGPMGIGVLWGRAELLAKLPPYMGGGEMITEVRTDGAKFREPPARFEAGTPNVGGAIALAAAVDYLAAAGWDAIREHDQRLIDRAMKAAEERVRGRVKVVGPPRGEEREAVLSFVLEGVHPHDVASLLDAEGICVRAGHHCTQPLMHRLKVPALTRASPYLYNTPAEVDRLFEALERIDALFSRAPASAAR